MNPLFSRGLPAQYRMLGEPVTFKRLADGIGAAGVGVTAIIDRNGGTGGIDALMKADGPTLRVRAAEVATVARGDTFAEAGGTLWRAREAFDPLFDGAELAGSVAKVAV